MNKSKYKIYNGKSLKRIFDNSRVYMLAVMFACGIIIGVFLIKTNSDFAEKVSVIFNSYIIRKGEQGIMSNFSDSFITNSALYFLNLFLGFSVIGFPFILIIPFLKGLGLGAMSGYLYSAYKLSGFGYCMLLIYPCNILCVYALIQACNDSAEYSKNAYLKALKSKGQYEKNETRVYLLRQLVFLGLCCISALIDAVSFKLFSSLFKI